MQSELLWQVLAESSDSSRVNRASQRPRIIMSAEAVAHSVCHLTSPTPSACPSASSIVCRLNSNTRKGFFCLSLSLFVVVGLAWQWWVSSSLLYEFGYMWWQFFSSYMELVNSADDTWWVINGCLDCSWWEEFIWRFVLVFGVFFFFFAQFTHLYTNMYMWCNIISL